MCRLCKFIVAGFGQFSLKSTTCSYMEPGFLVATGCRRDSHLLYRLIGVNVRILRVNLSLLCRHGVSMSFSGQYFLGNWIVCIHCIDFGRELG